MYRPKPLVKLRLRVPHGQKFRLSKQPHVVTTDLFWIELRFHMEIPWIIFLRIEIGRCVMVEDERDKLFERKIGQIDSSPRLHKESIRTPEYASTSIDALIGD